MNPNRSRHKIFNLFIFGLGFSCWSSTHTLVLNIYPIHYFYILTKASANWYTIKLKISENLHLILRIVSTIHCIASIPHFLYSEAAIVSRTLQTITPNRTKIVRQLNRLQWLVNKFSIACSTTLTGWWATLSCLRANANNLRHFAINWAVSNDGSLRIWLQNNSDHTNKWWANWLGYATVLFENGKLARCHIRVPQLRGLGPVTDQSNKM